MLALSASNDFQDVFLQRENKEDSSVPAQKQDPRLHG